MGIKNKNLMASILGLFCLIVIFPMFFFELFPFSRYPMLSQSWKTYSWVYGKSPEAKRFIKENQINSNYFGVPQHVAFGRAYPQTLLLFGKVYTVSEVKALMSLVPIETKLCFTLKNYGQDKNGSYGVRLSEDFCLGSAK